MQKEYFVTFIFSVKNSHEDGVECPVFRVAIGSITPFKVLGQGR
jgi:hypothetical protein